MHAVGVLHRDVKPSNVLMEGRTPILIDFGLARVADDPKLTHTGWFLGTPGYLAPEILHGDDATTASDVHSWAATVAFAGTGHPPFGRGPSMAIMDRVRRGEHDLERAARRPARRSSRPPSTPTRPDRPPLGEIRARLADPTSRPVRRHRSVRRWTTRSRSRWRSCRPTTGAAAVDAMPPAASPTAGARPARPAPRPLPPTAAGCPESGRRSGRPAGRPRRRPRARAAAGRAPPRRRSWPARPGSSAPRSPRLALSGPPVRSCCASPGCLRTCTMTATAHHGRRRLRGARWYDVLVAPLSAPWYLLAAAPGALLLGALGARHRRRRGLCSATPPALSTATTLFVAGLCLAAGSVARARCRPRPLAGPRGRAPARASYRTLGGLPVVLVSLAGFLGHQAARSTRLVAVRETAADRPLSPRFHRPFGTT